MATKTTISGKECNPMPNNTKNNRVISMTLKEIIHKLLSKKQPKIKIEKCSSIYCDHSYDEVIRTISCASSTKRVRNLSI